MGGASTLLAELDWRLGMLDVAAPGDVAPAGVVC